MLITEKILECCYYYSLCDKKTTNAMNYIKGISRTTFNKYVLIGEMLDYNLLNELDKKGKYKLSIGFAEQFVKMVYNPDFQLELYDQLSNLSNKEKKENLSSLLECSICCESSGHQLRLPCCGIFICVECIYKHIATIINDIVFIGIKCPCCNVPMKGKFIKMMLKPGKYPSMKWMNNIVYLNGTTHTLQRTYYINLLRKLLTIIRKVEVKVRRRIDIDTFDFSGGSKYYGICQECCPIMSNIHRVRNFGSMKVSTINKQCVNGDGNIVVLNSEMFMCNECKGEEEVEIKKCPHCGIRTVKPDGCNYVVCGDHRWCWICNERLEDNHNGHNVHYWMGPGTSPYSSECRQSENYDAPKFILHKCNCFNCRNNGGKRLCRNLECMNRCPTGEEFCGMCNSGGH